MCGSNPRLLKHCSDRTVQAVCLTLMQNGQGTAIIPRQVAKLELRT